MALLELIASREMTLIGTALLVGGLLLTAGLERAMGVVTDTLHLLHTSTVRSYAWPGEAVEAAGGALLLAGLSLAVGSLAVRWLLPPLRWVKKLLATLTQQLPEESDERNGGQLVAAVLAGHGVRHIFTLCGGHISTILIGCKAAGIQVVDTRIEATAVFAADAMSRLTGTPGVVAVTAGPGVTNAVTAVKNAQMAQSAMIVLGMNKTTENNASHLFTVAKSWISEDKLRTVDNTMMKENNTVHFVCI